MTDETDYEKVVTGLGIVDRSLVHHHSEVARLLELRGTLAARLEDLGGTPPPAPERRTAAPTAPKDWLDDMLAGQAPATVALEPIANPRLAAKVEATLATPRVAPKVVEALPLGAVVLGARRYQRVLLKASDIPDNLTVWCLEGPINEAHLKASHSEFRGIADCGRTTEGPTERWWSPERSLMEAQVELCRDCALLIRGVLLP